MRLHYQADTRISSVVTSYGHRVSEYADQFVAQSEISKSWERLNMPNSSNFFSISSAGAAEENFTKREVNFQGACPTTNFCFMID